MAVNRDDFASVFLAYRGSLARAVRRIVGNHDVEDILQEAFVRTWESDGRDAIRDARAFLLRTATNLAINHVSRAAYRTTGSLDSLDEAHSADGAVPPDVQIDSDQRFRSFCRAVGGLPEQCRRVFILKKVYGLSQQEIAAQVGIAESTVEKHIARGLVLCREHMLAEAAGAFDDRKRRRA